MGRNLSRDVDRIHEKNPGIFGKIEASTGLKPVTPYA
jgi:hypothetical protein